MNVDEATELLPQILNANFEGQVRRVGPAPPPGMQDIGGWVVENAETYCFCRVSRGGEGFIWIRAGIALAIPRSNDIGWFVATANRDLVIGRAYVAAGEEMAMVVVEDITFIAALSWSHQATFTDLAGRILTAVSHAEQLRRDTLERFGGRPFGGDDWQLLMM